MCSGIKMQLEEDSESESITEENGRGVCNQMGLGNVPEVLHKI